MNNMTDFLIYLAESEPKFDFSISLPVSPTCP